MNMSSNIQVLTHILSAGSTPIGPQLIPPSFPPGAAGSPLVVSVPNVRGAAPPQAACTINSGGGNTDFSTRSTRPPPTPPRSPCRSPGRPASPTTGWRASC
jgi:hypothetical protein